MHGKNHYLKPVVTNNRPFDILLSKIRYKNHVFSEQFD